MIRRYGAIVALAALSTLVLFLQTLFDGDGKYVRVPLVFLSLVAVIASVRYLEHRLAPPAIQTLRQILNSCAKQASRITTVAKFLTQTDEDSLISGDEVHILTNSLKGYDMTPPAMAVIADNLRDGVRYIYYLPQKSEYPGLEQEKEGFVRSVEQASGRPNRVVEENLRIYLVEEPCLYNFAVVFRAAPSEFKGYWYITTPSPPEQSDIPKPEPPTVSKAETDLDPSLVILRLSTEMTEDLWRLFAHLRRSSVRVSAVGLGLQRMGRD